MEAQGQPPPGEGPGEESSGKRRAPGVSEAQRDTPWVLIAIGVAALYAVIVAVLNSESVKVDFLFFSTEVRLLVLIFLCLGLGFVVGYFFDRYRRRQRRAD